MRSLKVLLLMAFFIPVASFAANVAVLDSAVAVSNSNYVKNRQNTLKSRVKGQQDRAERLANELDKIRKNLQRNEMTLSSADKRKLQSDYSVKAAELKSLQQSLGEQFQEFEQEVLKAVEPSLQKAVSAIVKRKNIDVLVDSQAVFYVNPSLDITEEVTAALNASNIR